MLLVWQIEDDSISSERSVDSLCSGWLSLPPEYRYDNLWFNLTTNTFPASTPQTTKCLKLIQCLWIVEKPGTFITVCYIRSSSRVIQMHVILDACEKFMHDFWYKHAFAYKIFSFQCLEFLNKWGRTRTWNTVMKRMISF